jgi:hypothetical protein
VSLFISRFLMRGLLAFDRLSRRFANIGNRSKLSWPRRGARGSCALEMPLSFLASWSSEAFHDCNNVILRVVRRDSSPDIDWWEPCVEVDRPL